MTDKLPTLPIIIPGVKPPPFQNEEKIYAVEKTSPQAYLDEIKKLAEQIDKYRGCLGFKGYKVVGVAFHENITASKITTII